MTKIEEENPALNSVEPLPMPGRSNGPMPVPPGIQSLLPQQQKLTQEAFNRLFLRLSLFFAA